MFFNRYYFMKYISLLFFHYTSFAYSAMMIALNLTSSNGGIVGHPPFLNSSSDDAPVESSNTNSNNSWRNISIDIPMIPLQPPVSIVPADRRYGCTRHQPSCSIVSDSNLLLPNNTYGWSLNDITKYVLAAEPVDVMPFENEEKSVLSTPSVSRKGFMFESFGSFIAPDGTGESDIVFRVWIIRNLSEIALGWYNVEFRDPRNSSKGAFLIGLLNITEFDIPLPTTIDPFTDLPADPCQVRLIILTTFFGTALAVLVILLFVSIIGTLRLPKFNHIFCGVCYTLPANSQMNGVPPLVTSRVHNDDYDDDEGEISRIQDDAQRRRSSSSDASDDGSPQLSVAITDNR